MANFAGQTKSSREKVPSLRWELADPVVIFAEIARSVAGGER
jgi:hypothetical protein